MRAWLATIFTLAVVAPSCSVVREISQSVISLSRCTCKLVNVADPEIAGVKMTGKSSVSVTDGLTLGAALARGELPAACTVNVGAINPNDGTGGTTKSSAVLTGFAWRLFLDDSQTIAGDRAAPVTIPGSGDQVIIPLRITLDLARFFKDSGYDHIVTRALALAGSTNTVSRGTVRA